MHLHTTCPPAQAFCPNSIDLWNATVLEFSRGWKPVKCLDIDNNNWVQWRTEALMKPNLHKTEYEVAIISKCSKTGQGALTISGWDLLMSIDRFLCRMSKDLTYVWCQSHDKRSNTSYKFERENYATKCICLLQNQSIRDRWFLLGLIKWQANKRGNNFRPPLPRNM